MDYLHLRLESYVAEITFKSYKHIISSCKINRVSTGFLDNSVFSVPNYLT